MTDMIQLIYSSTPFGFDDAMLNGILMDARRHNRRTSITGALICRADLYLQLLEGPREAVGTTFERIASDVRHTDVTLRFTGPASARLFPDWAMRDDPARSWMWTPDEVYGGALDRASLADLLGVFGRLAASAD